MYSVVETGSGRLRGHFSDGIFAFKGVRFAAPQTPAAHFKRLYQK
jgi:carboxylesterase type B